MHALHCDMARGLREVKDKGGLSKAQRPFCRGKLAFVDVLTKFLPNNSNLVSILMLPANCGVAVMQRSC